jgi:hypothetical protein
MSKRKKAKEAAAAAAAAAAEAAAAAKAEEAKKKKEKKGGFGRLVFFALVAGVVALAASEPLRSKVLDVLFGAEEEFQYSPPVSTTPATPASQVGAA